MRAYLGGSDRVGIKWVAGFEQNRVKRMPYMYGVFVLNDAETGRPLALMDGGWITEMRTAGVSGVVVRQVAGQPRRLAIVGAGVQGRRHLELLLDRCPSIEQVRVFDAVPDASDALLERAADREGVLATSAEQALESAELVVTLVTVPIEPRLECVGDRSGRDPVAGGLDEPSEPSLPTSFVLRRRRSRAVRVR